MKKSAILKKIEEIITDKELDDDCKMMFIATYLKIARKLNKKSK